MSTMGAAMKKLRLGLEWFLNPDHVPLLVGQEQGWFAEAGLALELVEPSEHIDAIEERGGDPVSVSPLLIGCALAQVLTIAIVSLRARIHSRDQLKAGGKLGLTSSARDGDAACLHRFPQYIKYASIATASSTDVTPNRLTPRDVQFEAIR